MGVVNFGIAFLSPLLCGALIALAVWGLKPGIDFAGGQVMEVKQAKNQDEVKAIFVQAGVRDLTITSAGDGVGDSTISRRRR
ncbi:MAG: hypothetical protein U0526_03580 [Candidatus Saccharibacteria bacterium]